MILPTMNDDEKAFEAFRMTSWLSECYQEWKAQIEDRFSRGTKFPYIQRGSVVDDKNNKWVFLFICPSKEMKKRRIYKTMAYTTYDIPRKRKEYDVNAGKGCLMFDPLAMKSCIDGKSRCMIMDIVPHAINRYTERYLKPLGKENIEFGLKLENMLLRWQWFDISADLHCDKNAETHKKGNICPYDVIMRGGGILRGQVVNEMMIRFTTYVGKDMMFDNQIKRQNEMVGEYYRMKSEGLIP